MKNAIVVGCSDGIGLALVKSLLNIDFHVTGISKSCSDLSHQNYTHFVADVSSPAYIEILKDILSKLSSIELCTYCAGVGEPLTVDNLWFEEKTFEVNLMGAVRTTTNVVGVMLKQGHGHFIGLSSIADAVLSKEAPSYSASKAGISSFWESMALFVKDKGVNISNIRFGFVDTKMAKGNFKPFMLSVESAVSQIMEVIERPRFRLTKSIRMDLLARIMGIPDKLSVLLK